MLERVALVSSTVYGNCVLKAFWECCIPVTYRVEKPDLESPVFDVSLNVLSSDPDVIGCSSTSEDPL